MPSHSVPLCSEHACVPANCLSGFATIAEPVASAEEAPHAECWVPLANDAEPWLCLAVEAEVAPEAVPSEVQERAALQAVVSAPPGQLLQP